MKYMINYQNHDKGAKDGSMIRETIERAKKSVKLMKECGYTVVTCIKIKS